MMDPLSVTASIIAVLQLTTTLTGYINDVRHASREQAKVAVEASNLYGLLTNLRFRVDEAKSDDPWFNQVKLLGVENGPLDQFKGILERMVKQITSSRKRDQLKSVLTWKFTKSEVEDALTQMERLKSLVQCALTEDVFTLSQAIHGDVVILGEQMKNLDTRTERLQTYADQDLQNRLARWLGIPDPSTNYHAALKKRHPETGLWLVNGTQFEDWKRSESSIMWLHGNAGCGKTILSATALHSVLQHQDSRPDTTVGYFYFDFNDIEKQSSSKAIRSLLFQFAQRLHNGIRGLEQLYQKCGFGQEQPAEDAIQSLLQSTINEIESKYILLDALDECTDREDLLTSIGNLISSKPKGLHIMTTSRRERDIEERLRPIANKIINIQSAIVDEDIRIYVQDRLAKDPKLKIWPESVQIEITTVLMEKAQGMFRWAYCQLESIRECIRLRLLRQALLNLPKTLEDTYDRILQDLEKTDHFRDTIVALQWLCYSKRPLRLSEMVEVLAIENGEDGWFSPEERLPDPAYVMKICSSLISCNVTSEDDGTEASEKSEASEVNEVNELYEENEDNEINEDNQIQIAHFSVKQYLLSNRYAFRPDFQAQVCHAQMAEGCLRYLLYLSEQAPLTQEIVDEYPLALYAAKYWPQHAQNIKETDIPTVLDLSSRLLTGERALLSWVQLCNPEDIWSRALNVSYTSDDLAQPLYYAALIGVSELVDLFLQLRHNVNAQGGEYGSALQAASREGHKKVVQMLLDAGADVNTQVGMYGNALQAASRNNHEQLVQLLLDAGANVNAQGGTFYGNSLQAASAYGYEKVVQMLLDAGANANAQGGMYGSALQAASIIGNENLVRTLLDAGADVNAQGGDYYGNALQAASRHDHQKLVQMLVDAGADVNAQGGMWNANALQAASEDGNEKVVQILLCAGADVNAQGGNRFDNALQAASRNGHEDVVKVLLDAGANVNTPGELFDNALEAALRNGHAKVVQMLLDAGANFNTQGGDYGNALLLASISGNEKVVQMLLDAGADVNAQGGDYGTPLQAASVHRHEKVVQILLNAGAKDDRKTDTSNNISGSKVE